MEFILSLPCKDAREQLDKTFAIVTIFTGMRKEDLNSTLSRDVRFVKPTKTCDRHVEFVAYKTKNDPMGTGPVDGRTFRVPCICGQTLSGAEKKDFNKMVAQDYTCSCAVPCPFDVVRDYLRAIPDCRGDQREKERESNKELQPLRFLRALTTTGGQRRFLVTPRGK